MVPVFCRKCQVSIFPRSFTGESWIDTKRTGDCPPPRPNLPLRPAGTQPTFHELEFVFVVDNSKQVSAFYTIK